MLESMHPHEEGDYNPCSKAAPTISHIYSICKDSGFPMACADAAAVYVRRSSIVNEVNRGCGSLGAESHAWVVLQLWRLSRRWSLWTEKEKSALRCPRLAVSASQGRSSRMGNDSELEVCHGN